jgi:acetoin utilization protein AcuB
MLVKNWMSSPAITIDADAMLPKAKKLLNHHRIHMLPVMEGVYLAGIVTELDLSKAVGFDTRTEKSLDLEECQPATKIRDVMVKNVDTVPYNHTIQEVAEILLLNHISGIPVVGEQKEIIGVITKTDIFNYIILLAGGTKNGVELGLELVDRPGSVKEITDTIRDYGARVSSILSTPQRAGRGHRRVYIRIYDIDRPTRQRLGQVIKDKASVLYVVDHVEKTRELFKKEGEL